MTDPFSVTGTAVGIVSLGLQTFQILYKYCSDFKSFPRDVEAIQRQIRGLEGILEGLCEVKEQLEIDNHTPSSQLHMALKECEETLYELKRMVEKRNPISQSDGIQTQLRAVKERMLWPYRKEDLKEVRSSLAKFQANLALALQCAGLDGALRRLREVHTELIVQQKQAIRVEQTLNENTEVLQMIRRDVASQSPGLLKIYDEIMSLRAQLSENIVSVEIGKHPLADSDLSSRKLTLTSPSTAYAFSHKGDHECTSQLSKQSCFAQIEKSNSCHCRSKRKRKVESRRWYKILTDEAYDHHKDCPRSTYGDYTKSVAIQLSIYNSLLKFCVQIGWQCSRKGGWNSPAPVLRHRAVAPQDSPVFRILNSAIEKIDYRDSYEQGCSQMAIIFPTIAPKLQQEFRKGACPTNLDTRGNGILYAVLHLIALAIDLMDSREKFMSAVSKVIDVCFDAGVPFDDQDAEGRNPVEYWLLRPLAYPHHTHEWKLRYGHVLFCVAKRTESWSFALFTPYPLNSFSYQIVFDNISALLQLESFSNTFTEDDSRREVIFRRSELDFATRLIAPGVDTWASLFAKYDSVSALASWPGGLTMMLSNPNVSLSQDLLEMLLEAAITMRNIKSIEVLLNYEVPITRKTWDDITRRFFEFESHDKQTNFSLTKIYHHIASHLYEDHNAGSDDQISTRSFESVNITDKTSSLYHNICLTLLSAESAWQAGHRGVESIALSNLWFPRETRISTSLWVQALSWISCRRARSEFIAIFRWLMRHGADPFWVHPIHLTTPAHLLARHSLAGGILNSEYREDISVLRDRVCDWKAVRKVLASLSNNLSAKSSGIPFQSCQ